MRELLLLRHAKSAWSDPSLEDHDRPLNRRGREAAALIGRFLLSEGLVPDLALVSSALRTRQTWTLVSEALGDAAPKERVLEQLYLAAPGQILAAVADAPAKARRLLVLGHNPGMERLAAALAGPSSADEALGRLHDKFPTGALARIRFDAADWAEATEGPGELVAFVRPRDLSPLVAGD